MSDVLDDSQKEIKLGLEELIDRTQRRLRDQGEVPLSPGLSINGQIVLCGAAALVTEAVALTNSKEAAVRFALEAVERDSEYIVRAGETIGLPAIIVRGVLVSNDKLGESERLVGVLKHFDGLNRGWGQARTINVTR